MDYTYDLFDRVIKESYSDGTEYLYFYDTEDRLTRQCCVKNGTVEAVYVFEYDSLGRLIRSRQTEGGSLYGDFVDEGTTLQRTEHLYDLENRIVSQSWQLGSQLYSEQYTFNDKTSTNGIKDGSINTLTLQPLDKTLSFSYDSLKHLSSVAVPNLYKRTYTYKGLTSLRSSNLISRVDYTANNSGNFSRLYYDYTYDEVGNITKIKQNGSTIASYTYDKQGQLLTETRGNYTRQYTYDTAGNLLNTYEEDVTLGTYTYGNSKWKDQLTAYNGHSISYDNSGNPLNWYNGSTYSSLTWEKGRQLSSLTKGSTAISYQYDMSGIRSQKTVGSTTYNYLTQNGQVVRQSWGSNILDIIYDNNAQPFALRHSTDNGQSFYDYYYILNQQGDVVRLVNSAGTTVANYTYDAWGKVLTATGTMASINPIRYRGYFYDAETGWYYLQSRYYDPAIGRFINADIYLTTGQGFIGGNMFAYSLNNPIKYSDITGNIAGIDDAAFATTLVIAVGFIALAYYLTTPAPQRSLNDLANSINTAVSNTGTAIFKLLLSTSVVLIKQLDLSKERARANYRTKAITKIEEEKIYQYWHANYIEDLDLYIPGKPLKISEARDVVRSGGSVFAATKLAAFGLARIVGIGPPIWHAPHRRRSWYLPHYHGSYKSGKKMNGHIFYYF